MTTPRRALIVVDVQQEYFDGPLQIQYPPREESLANILSAVKVAGANDVPVVVVQHQMPEGAPVFVEGTPGWSLHPELEGHIDPATKRVHKQYASIFAGTDVAEWLRAKDIDTITIVGYMTNNCDLGTAVEAEALGFSAEILSDATGAIHLANEAGQVSAQSLHETLMVLLQSNFAAVTTTTEWADAVDSGTSLPKSNLVVSAIQGRESVTS
ncbi:cysteine hydrolase [Rhodococcus sp. ACPA4]|uniref:Nicotinamidase-related amidase n=1 Tax=Nocardia globerula TaxID=1818 RepID=A0A652YLL6_NOCGL|nr:MULTISPECIES: cysteine hydrolase family protein [Rhodococcus]NMD60035.1 cysteine hydrolase [Nocardia globerula]PBC42547.1 cysteine hydrolase [Rhodococcus sp. ACPA4]PVX63859.1 nicotinamidase-related amidase [Rhodococcus globerulus]